MFLENDLPCIFRISENNGYKIGRLILGSCQYDRGVNVQRTAFRDDRTQKCTRISTRQQTDNEKSENPDTATDCSLALLPVPVGLRHYHFGVHLSISCFSPPHHVSCA